MRYGVLTTKGYFNFDDICFGRLCRLPMALQSAMGLSSSERMTEEDMLKASLLSGLVGPDFLAVDFPVKINVSSWSDALKMPAASETELTDIAITMLLEVLEECQMYAGMWIYQPAYKTFRVMCDNPYDQVATLLFLLRNLTQKANVRMFVKLRSLGYRPLIAATMAHMFWLERRFGIASDDSATVATMTTEEYNWFNPQTLTKSDFVKLLKQEELPEWFGEHWNGSDFGGYKRDDWFESEDIKFREELIDTYNFDYEEDGDEEECDDDCGNNGPYYKLVDVFSSRTAEFTPPLSLQHDYRSGGFVLARNSIPLAQMLEALDEVLAANGITAK